MYVKFVSYADGETFMEKTVEVSEVETKELSATDVALGQILVTTRKGGIEQTHSLSKNIWHTCFVMNTEGKTIDRYFAPSETNDAVVEVAA